MRVLQSGSGPVRHVLVAWFCGVSIAKFAMLLPSAMVIEMSGSKEPVTRTQLEALVRSRGAELGELATIGYSAGCHGVRNALGIRPDIILAIDGTHGSIPQPGGMPIAPWQAEGTSRPVPRHGHRPAADHRLGYPRACRRPALHPARWKRRGLQLQVERRRCRGPPVPDPGRRARARATVALAPLGLRCSCRGPAAASHGPASDRRAGARLAVQCRGARGRC